MAEVNLLNTYPKAVRDVKARLKDKERNRLAALRYDVEYFDGPREQGYGGYAYDGRWIPVAQTIIRHFGLKPEQRVLDVGSAKGFLVKDLADACPGLYVYGLDISHYALSHCHTDAAGRQTRGSADALPFPDGSFDAVISINTIHNLEEERCIAALREIERLSPGRAFVQVDAYRNDAERAHFEEWMLTAKTYGKPDDWKTIFKTAGYTGDYYWTILEMS